MESRIETSAAPRARERRGALSVVVLGEADDRTSTLRAQLAARGYRTVLAPSLADCVAVLEREGANLVVVDTLAGGLGTLDALRTLRELDPHLDVVVTAPANGFGPADVFDAGAFEYLPQAHTDSAAFLGAVGVALGARRGDVQLRYLRQKDGAQLNLESIVGEHPAMRRTYAFVRQFCSRTLGGAAPTVLLLGETGTGKGLIAKCIHYNGGRRAQPFVEVNCAAIPAALIESELFGYERGAFTDAKTSRAGLFETADKGTLFLDEIASMPMSAQAKLLTALEEKRVRRVGGRHGIDVDVQIIAASQPVLRRAVRRGEFRADLYHRLNVVSLTLPPLRDRGADKLKLAEAFVAECCGRYGMAPRPISPSAQTHILSHDWPGNVRELRNQIERVVLLSDDPIIETWHLDRPASIAPPPSSRSEESGVSAARPDEGAGAYLLRLPVDGIALDHIERDAILQALDRCDGNVSGAARFLRVTRQTLTYRMKKHGIVLTSRRPQEPSHRREDADTGS